MILSPVTDLEVENSRLRLERRHTFANDAL